MLITIPKNMLSAYITDNEDTQLAKYLKNMTGVTFELNDTKNVQNMNILYLPDVKIEKLLEDTAKAIDKDDRVKTLDQFIKRFDSITIDESRKLIYTDLRDFKFILNINTEHYLRSLNSYEQFEEQFNQEFSKVFERVSKLKTLLTNLSKLFDRLTEEPTVLIKEADSILSEYLGKDLSNETKLTSKLRLILDSNNSDISVELPIILCIAIRLYSIDANSKEFLQVLLPFFNKVVERAVSIIITLNDTLVSVSNKLKVIDDLATTYFQLSKMFTLLEESKLTGSLEARASDDIDIKPVMFNDIIMDIFNRTFEGVQEV